MTHVCANSPDADNGRNHNGRSVGKEFLTVDDGLSPGLSFTDAPQRRPGRYPRVMRLVAQRVSSASVTVGGEVVGAIDRPGLLVLVGVTHDDAESDAVLLADKIWNLRILAEERSCAQTRAPLLVVSQFTLYADTRKGRRPSWSAAAPRAVSEPLVQGFVNALRAQGADVATGVFGADMQVASVNDGPVTVILDSPRPVEEARR